MYKYICHLWQLLMFKPQYSLLPDIAIGRKVTLPVSPPQSERYPLLYNSFKQTAKKEIQRLF